MFDTLKLARRLEGAGFTHEQADGAAAALAETFSGEMATKSDVAGIGGNLIIHESDMAALMSCLTDMRSTLIPSMSEAMALRFTMKLNGLEFRLERAHLRSVMREEFRALQSSMARWFIAAMLVNILTAFGAVAAVWQVTRH